MQLILADDENVQVVESSKAFSDVSYSFCVGVNRPGGSSSNKYDAANLVSVITGEESSVLNVWLTAPNSRVLVNSGSDTNRNGFNLFKSLRERFQDKIRISLEMSETSDEDEEGNCSDFKLCIASRKGMAIDADRLDCRAKVPYVAQFFNSLKQLKVTALRIKVTAHIADDDLIIPLASLTNQKILEDDAASDVIIEAENGAEIKSHKCFLISTSSVFQRMFRNEMKESKNGRIDMTDISEEGIRAFLRFIYYGDVIGLEEKIDVAYNLLYAAHKYDVPKLESFMRTYLIARKDEDFYPKMAFKTFSFVRGIEAASEITAKMVRIMSMNFGELKQLPEFKEVFQKKPDDALEICSIVVESLKKKFEPEQNKTSKDPSKQGESGPILREALEIPFLPTLPFIPIAGIVRANDDIFH